MDQSLPRSGVRTKVTADGQHKRVCPDVGVVRRRAVLSESQRVHVRALQYWTPSVSLFREGSS